jgi:hypothetical protein
VCILCSAIQKGLASWRLLHTDVGAVSSDRCLVNFKAHVDIDVQAQLERMVQDNALPASSGKLLNLFEGDSPKGHA